MAKREEQKENPSKYNISRTTIIFIVFSVTGRIDYLASFMYIYIYIYIQMDQQLYPRGKLNISRLLARRRCPAGSNTVRK